MKSIREIIFYTMLANSISDLHRLSITRPHESAVLNSPKVSRLYLHIHFDPFTSRSVLEWLLLKRPCFLNVF